MHFLTVGSPHTYDRAMYGLGVSKLVCWIMHSISVSSSPGSMVMTRAVSYGSRGVYWKRESMVEDELKQVFRGERKLDENGTALKGILERLQSPASLSRSGRGRFIARSPVDRDRDGSF